MALKRSADELKTAYPRPRQREAKRPKLSPTAEQHSDSSVPSSCSISEDSALQSSPSASERTRKTSLSSIRSSISAEDSESPIDNAESATESVSDDEEEIITIGGPKKPRMAHDNVTAGATDLRSRLDALLPQLAASNDLLASSEGHFSMEDVDDGDQHIEMNLGLGVLEERNGDESSRENGDCEVSKGEEDGESDLSVSLEGVKPRPENRKPNVMGNLLGRPPAGQKPGIEDLG